MSIILKQLCSDTETKYNLKLVAGKNGMTNTVRWVHMVEDRQVPDFLHGGELVFTTGIGHIGKDPLLAFVKRLINHGASGVVVNIGTYLAGIPQEVIDYCNKENFPLFTLPWSVYIIDITYDFCRRIIENEKIETTAAEAFKSIILTPEQGKKYYSFLEQHGFGKAVGYRVFTLNLFRDGKNITEDFERSNHIKLWNILAKSKDYPSAMFVLENTAVVVRQDVSRNSIKNITDTLDAVSEQKNIAYTMGISTQRNGYKSVAKLREQVIYEGADNVAAIVMETITGSNGVIIPPRGYLNGVRKICDEFGIMMICDEVMAGFGRTGKMFAFENFGVKPDIVSFAKGVTCGYVQLGGVVVSKEIAEYFDDHLLSCGLTYSGHPLACAAGVACLKFYDDAKILDNVNISGKALGEELEALKDKYDIVGDVRYIGLFSAIELVRDRKTKAPLVEYGKDPAGIMKSIIGKLKEKGFMTYSHENMILICPPLIITPEQIKEEMKKVDEVIAEINGIY